MKQTNQRLNVCFVHWPTGQTREMKDKAKEAGNFPTQNRNALFSDVVALASPASSCKTSLTLVPHNRTLSSELKGVEMVHQNIGNKGTGRADGSKPHCGRSVVVVCRSGTRKSREEPDHHNLQRHRGLLSFCVNSAERKSIQCLVTCCCRFWEWCGRPSQGY